MATWPTDMGPPEGDKAAFCPTRSSAGGRGGRAQPGRGWAAVRGKISRYVNAITLICEFANASEGAMKLGTAAVWAALALSVGAALTAGGACADPIGDAGAGQDALNKGDLN